MFSRLAYISVGKVPPYRGKSLGVERWVRCVFGCLPFHIQFILLSFHPMSPSHPRSWLMGSFKTLLSAVSRQRCPSTSGLQTFVEIPCLLTARFLFSSLPWAETFYPFIVSEKVTGRRGNSTCAQLPCSRNPVIILLPLMMGDYCRLRKQAIKANIYQLLSIT